MSNQSQPIGIFDSGLGGLSILKEIHTLMPNEKIIYYADSKNSPYGEKSEQDIVDLSIKNTNLLIDNSCKLIVVACNTATTNAIHILREKFEVPFVGIEPAIKPAAIQSLNKKIGVLATKGTLSSKLFHNHAKILRQNTEIIEVIGKGIVEAIENNDTETTAFNNFLAEQLHVFKTNEVDHLVLGCSHYPFITDNIKRILGDNICIIDSGFAVAKQTKRILVQNNLENNKTEKTKINIITNQTSSNALKNVLKKLNLKLDDVKIKS